MIPGVPALDRLQAQRGQGSPGRTTGGWGDGGGGGRGGGGSRATPAGPAVIGVWLLVGAATILFVAFTSTLLVRRAEADWRVGPIPPVLWVTTAVLLASSASLEWARRGAAGGWPGAVRWGLAATFGLGVVFLAGQWAAWRQLAAAGIHLTSGAHSAFFFLLTGTHALHLAGGIVALGVALLRVRRIAPAQAAGAIAPVAVYWHFVDALWVYVFVMLFWM